MNSYWSLDSRESVLPVQDMAQSINQNSQCQVMRASNTAIQETKTGAPCYPLLNCTWRLQGLPKAPIPRVSKYRTSLLNLNCAKNEKVELTTFVLLASHSYACYHFNNKILGSDKTQPRTRLTGKKSPTAPDTHVALFFSIPVGSGPQVATPSVQ